MLHLETVCSCATRMRTAAQSAMAANHAHGKLAEHYGYAVNEHGVLLMLIEP